MDKIVEWPLGFSSASGDENQILAEYLLSFQPQYYYDNEETENTKQYYNETKTTTSNEITTFEGAGALASLQQQRESKKIIALQKRRQRNKMLARKTRLVKKNQCHVLQRRLLALALENSRLRKTLKDKLPESLQEEMCAKCCHFSDAFVATIVEEGERMMSSQNRKLSSVNVAAARLPHYQRCFLLSDPKQADNPIVFVSKAFLAMTQYSEQEVVGRNCRFLQGPNTNPQAVSQMRHAIATGAEVSVCVLNYKKDGTPFYNQIHISGVRDKDSNLLYFAAVCCEILSTFSQNMNIDDEAFAGDDEIGSIASGSIASKASGTSSLTLSSLSSF